MTGPTLVPNLLCQERTEPAKLCWTNCQMLDKLTDGLNMNLGWFSDIVVHWGYSFVVGARHWRVKCVVLS